MLPIALIFLAILFASPQIVFAAERPNVLFMAVDDLNDMAKFCGRYPDAKTPNMDRLAERGTVFTNAHCQFPLCGPSRASVMSGLFPWTLGYQDHVSDKALQRRAAELGTDLLHNWFAKHGYKTMAVGKVCHKHVPKGSVDESGGRGAFNEPTGRMRVNWPQNGTGTDWAASPERDDQLPDHHAAAWAVEQLQQQHDRPFLLMVGFLRPHVPWYVPQKWFDLYDRDELTLPPFQPDDLDDIPDVSRKLNIHPSMPRTDWAIENDQWRNIVHAYLASISFADHQVGKVLDALDASVYRDNTIIVLGSDHGYHMGEKNTFQKHSLWERSSHVPLVVAGGAAKAGNRCDQVVRLIDLYPTLLDMCSLPENPKNEGRSLVPLLQDSSTDWPWPAFTGWKQNSLAVQNDRYRYIYYDDGSEELYDHHADLHEHHNIANDSNYDQIKLELRQVLNSKSADAR